MTKIRTQIMGSYFCITKKCDAKHRIPLVRMTGLVAREKSVIAIVAQYAPIVSAAQVQVANIVCRQLKNCRKSVAVTKKRRTKSSFVV